MKSFYNARISGLKAELKDTNSPRAIASIKAEIKEVKRLKRQW